MQVSPSQVRAPDGSAPDEPAPDDQSGPDDQSFEAFYRAQADRVYRALAITLGDPQVAREAADEGMARAFARWSDVRSLQNPGGWVYRVGLNWATSFWRKRRREQPLPIGHEIPADDDPQATLALAAVRELPLAPRAVVVCRVLLGLSTVETAELLGIPTGTVKSRLARALTALRAALEEGSDANL
jgi:RNA polymerase sigma-70 factor (ECF subfamily)